MANISGQTNEKVYSVQKWYGLNEHPDGDTRLRLGEASKMVNWKITRDGNLKRRPGMEVLVGLCSSYSVNISTDIEKIMTFASADDKIIVYADVSATTKPGLISPVCRRCHADQELAPVLPHEAKLLKDSHVRGADRVMCLITDQEGEATRRQLWNVPRRRLD